MKNRNQEAGVGRGKQGGVKAVCLLKGMAVAYAVTCIFFIAYGILLTYSNVAESTIPTAALCCTAVSAGIAGYDWAKCIGKGWQAVRFNIHAMMPSCACKTALKKKSYLAGVLAPFVVLGLGSALFVFVYPGTVSFLTMMVNFVAVGADLLIAVRVVKEDNCLIADHPTKAGYIAFYKE